LVNWPGRIVRRHEIRERAPFRKQRRTNLLRLLFRHLCPRSGGELIYVPVLLAALLLSGPAGAAEPFGAATNPTPAQQLSPGVTPEQAAAMRQLVGSDPGAAKAVEDALRRKAEEA